MKRAVVIALQLAVAAALCGVFLLVGSDVDRVAAGEAPSRLLAATGLAVLSAIAGFAASAIGSRSLPATEAEQRRGILRHVFALGPAERSRERTGRIVSTATDGVERAAAFSETFVGPMVASVATPALVIAVVAIAIDGPAAAWLAVAAVVAPLAIGGFQRAFSRVSKQYRGASRALAARELDAIQGLTTLSLMGAGRAMGRRLAQASEDVRRMVMRYLAGNQLVLLVVDSLFSLAMVVGAICLALWRGQSGAITVGQGVALVLMSSVMLDPLDRIGQFFYIGMGGLAARKEIRRLREEPPVVVDPPGATDPGVRPGTVAFRDVSFGYGSVPVLRGVDFSIDEGEHVALVGPSGAGKTTVAALLQGWRRPDSGAVSIGGEDLATVPLAWVHDQIASIEQRTFLFAGTLRDNLLLADPGAPDDRLLEVLERARLKDLLDRLPQGLDTAVGERGLALSGGEAQRVAVGRALLRDARIWLLDEPTAHVDLASERLVLDALADATLGRTVLTISHRAATVERADRVLHLRDGRVS